jgi:hypothetical protein
MRRCEPPPPRPPPVVRWRWHFDRRGVIAPQFRRQLFQPLGAPRHENQPLRAARREQARERGPDSRRSAGDECVRITLLPSSRDRRSSSACSVLPTMHGVLCLEAQCRNSEPTRWEPRRRRRSPSHPSRHRTSRSRRWILSGARIGRAGARGRSRCTRSSPPIRALTLLAARSPTARRPARHAVVAPSRPALHARGVRRHHLPPP